jgi:hypothetical protein
LGNKIIKYKLPINLEIYKRKVNCYLYSYLFFLEQKKWIPKLYTHKNVWGVASSKIPKFHNKIPRRLYAAFKRRLNNLFS